MQNCNWRRITPHGPGCGVTSGLETTQSNTASTEATNLPSIGQPAAGAGAGAARATSPGASGSGQGEEGR